MYMSSGRWPYVIQRQAQVVRAILENPDYARFVKEFSWTLQFVVSDRQDWPYNEMLTEVRRVDLAFRYSETDPHRYPDTQSLFPKATHLRLVGKTHYSIVTAILHGEKAKLMSLCLNNLQDEGQLENGSPFSSRFFRETPLDMLHERWPVDERRGVVLPGPMRRILPQLEHRCSSLKKLTLRKVGHELPQLEDFYSKGDEEVYDEWASFIRAVKPPILTVEQGRDARWWWSGSERLGRRPAPISPPPARNMPPMNERFRKRLLPSLIEGGKACGG